ncbi:zincin [Cucurbitaria berberidis CBS 394.84]|uniref:Zincin n=1 Tax=Cucurbitaria berberidis CBS 394.84 TaxID=1168544 RepID=A0A9P4GPG2_9PLEO|nr:zincin [Cucurbitaria berberidis CBS 394.84]KAF1848756.1 zincin [Cucurbitaria berberidis CBS 394.84]
MVARISSLLLLGVSAVLATPLLPRQSVATVTVPAAPPSSTAWDTGAVHEYPIHASCNANQRAYLKKGLQETATLCRQARDHILRWGNSSDIYQKYFGDAPTGEPLGWFTKIVDGDKSDVLFRCDNIDGNCGQKGWAGHWRGSNGTSETVICDLSYEIRRPLEGMCMFGYDVANGATNLYWASDLLHRLLHVPKVGEGAVEHYGHEGKYSGVLSLAKENSTYAVKNSDTLQYFALEVYAHDIAVPGIGCAGTYTATSTAATTAMSAASVAASSNAATPSTAAATTTAVAEACTPHGDHWHCPPGVPEPSSPPS